MNYTHTISYTEFANGRYAPASFRTTGDAVETHLRSLALRKFSPSGKVLIKDIRISKIKSTK